MAGWALARFAGVRRAAGGAPGAVRGRSRTAPGDRCQRAHPRSVDRRALPV